MILFNSYIPEYLWLSNFSPHPVMDFPTAEHAYQAMKSTDESEWAKMKQCKSPAQAKKYSYTLQHLRPNWDKVKVPIMRRVLTVKFRDPELGQKLLDTGDEELVHLSPWDTYWGVDKNHKGHNTQGILLMELREELQCSNQL